MSFTVRNLTTSAVLINDLGIEIPASADVSLVDISPEHIAISEDLVNSITAGDVVVLNPIDNTTPLSASDSITVVGVANDPNWGIRGASINDLDDVDTTGSAPFDVLQLSLSGSYVPVTPAQLAGDISLGDLADVTTSGATANTAFILTGDGNNYSITAAENSLPFIESVQDITGGMIGTSTDLTIVYDDVNGQINYSIDDVFLRNTGDTLDSGTLTVAAGASINISSGASLIITDAPANGTDAVNKAYVDSVASGLDNKESCLVATTTDVGGTYSSTGGTGGTGSISGVDLTNIDGISPTVGDRILVKDQTDAKQNGIYVVVTAGATGEIERASDMDGDPASEVSGGNHTFVETGTVNGTTSWVVTGTGTLSLNVDDINWTQFSGSGTYTAGAGLQLNGSVFSIDLENLNSVSVQSTDEIAFHDTSDVSTNNTKKSTFANVITDLGIYTNSNLTASDGVTILSGDIQLDITGLPSNVGALSGTAEIAFDAGGTGVQNKATIQDVLNSLDIPNNITSNGFVVRTAEDVYQSRTLLADITNGHEGILVTNGDGVTADPTVGLSISGLAPGGTNLTSTDLIVIYDGTNNVSITGTQLADGVSAILGGLGNAYTTIEGDSGSSTASSSTDTLSLVSAINGGIVTAAADGSPDSVTFALDISGLLQQPAPITLTDEIAILDVSTNLSNRISFTSVVNDLGIVNGVGTTAGIIVSDGANGYSSTTLAVNGAGANDGLTLTNADGTTGNPTFGLDITGTPAAAENLAATDEVIVYNSSTASNEKMTGQELADGVSTIIGLDGVSISTINGQQVLTLVDTSRSNKILSVGDTSITWAEGRLRNNDWLQIGSAVDADSGYIVPMNATIVKVTAHTENNKGNTKDINLYIDGVVQPSPIVTFTGAAGEKAVRDITVDIDVNQDQKLRLRAGSTGGTIEDTVITLWLKWRA